MASILVDITLATTRRLQEAKSLQKKNSPTNLAPCPPFFVMPFFEGLAPGPNFPGQEKMVLLLLRPRRLRTESSSDTQGFLHVNGRWRRQHLLLVGSDVSVSFGKAWELYLIRLLNIWKKNQGKIFYAYILNAITDINSSNTSHLMNYELVLRVFVEITDFFFKYYLVLAFLGIKILHFQNF